MESWAYKSKLKWEGRRQEVPLYGHINEDGNVCEDTVQKNLNSPQPFTRDLKPGVVRGSGSHIPQPRGESHWGIKARATGSLWETPCTCVAIENQEETM